MGTLRWCKTNKYKTMIETADFLLKYNLKDIVQT